MLFALFPRAFRQIIGQTSGLGDVVNVANWLASTSIRNIPPIDSEDELSVLGTAKEALMVSLAWNQAQDMSTLLYGGAQNRETALDVMSLDTRKLKLRELAFKE